MDLFLQNAKYTIDASALFEMTRDDRKYPKTIFKNLWKDIDSLFSTCELVSHYEVLREIEKTDDDTDEVVKWAQDNKGYFLDYAQAETVVIREMGVNYADWINNKVGSIHADPWLIAQAKTRNLTIITEEKLKGTKTRVAGLGIPDVALHFGVKSLSVKDFIAEMGWTY